jgi:hypothetical protein
VKPSADYLVLDDDALLAQCRIDTFRVSGPGGQHRNRTDTAVRLTHEPSAVTAQASERRSQLQNRQQALRRLRLAIAHEVRRPVELERYTPPVELRAVVGAPKSKRLGPRHADYPRGVQRFLDLFVAVDAVVNEAAERAGVSTGALSRFIQADPPLLVHCNALRKERGLRPLRGR